MLPIRKVYVASWYANAPMVRVVHAWLRTIGIEPTSAWAEQADGQEDFSSFSGEKLREIALTNDAGIDAADAMIVIADKGVGGETFAEVRYALDVRRSAERREAGAVGVDPIPVFWVGRRILSAYREGVTRISEDWDGHGQALWPGVAKAIAAIKDHNERLAMNKDHDEAVMAAVKAAGPASVNTTGFAMHGSQMEGGRNVR